MVGRRARRPARTCCGIRPGRTQRSDRRRRRRSPPCRPRRRRSATGTSGRRPAATTPAYPAPGGATPVRRRPRQPRRADGIPRAPRRERLGEGRTAVDARMNAGVVRAEHQRLGRAPRESRRRRRTRGLGRHLRRGEARRWRQRARDRACSLARLGERTPARATDPRDRPAPVEPSCRPAPAMRVRNASGSSGKQECERGRTEPRARRDPCRAAHTPLPAGAPRAHA